MENIDYENESKMKMEVVEKYLNDPKSKHDPKTKALLHEMMRRVIEEGKMPGEAMGLSQEDLVLLYTLGYQMFETGQFKDALNVFDVLSLLFPLNPVLTLAKGTCLQRVKNWEGAIEQYLVAAHLDHSDPIPYYYCYECYIQLEEPLYAGMMLRCVIDRCADVPAFQAMKAKSELMLLRVEAEAAVQKKPGKISQKMKNTPQVLRYKQSA